MIGKRVDKYEILDEVGAGGMATVYRARDRRLDREVAIKILHPHLARQAEARQRFHREAHAVARLRHPNILEIYDYSGAAAPVCFIVTEFIRGESLRQHLARGPLEIPEIAAIIALRVLEALQHAHAHGVIHRDVKPENVLLTREGAVKLADFGIAYLVDGQGMTLTGALLGSPAHMSPEQIQGTPLGPASDLFSLGTMLYLMVTGRLPYEASNPQALFHKILNGSHLPVQQLAPRVSDRLARIIERSLAPSAADRYQSARAMADDLQAELKENGFVDPERELWAYFQDPVSYEAQTRHALLERLILRAEELLAGGQRARALSFYNRALSLEPHEPRVLAAVRSIGRRTLWLQAARRAGLATAAMVLLALLALWGQQAGWFGSVATEQARPGSASPPSPDGIRPSVPPLAAATSLAESAQLVTEPEPLVSPSWLPEPSVTRLEPGEPPSTEHATPSTPANPSRVGLPEPPARRTTPAGVRVASTSPLVPNPGDAEAKPDPQRKVPLRIHTEPWTQIKINGVAVGRQEQHHRILLETGVYQISVEHPQCVGQEFQVRVTPTTTQLAPRTLRLDWLPASVRIDGPVGAELIIERKGKRQWMGYATSENVYKLEMKEAVEQVTFIVVAADKLTQLLRRKMSLRPATQYVIPLTSSTGATVTP